MPHRKANTQIKIIISYPTATASMVEADEVAADWVQRLATDRRIPPEAQIETEIWSEDPHGEFTNGSLTFQQRRDLTPPDGEQ